MSVAARTWATSSSGMPTDDGTAALSPIVRPRFAQGRRSMASAPDLHDGVRLEAGGPAFAWPTPSGSPVLLAASSGAWTFGTSEAVDPRRLRATPPGQDRLGGGQAGHRDPEGRAAHVVEPGVVEEADRLGVAAVLAADADLEVRPGGPAPLGPEADQLADAVGVDHLEGVARQQAQLEVGGHHPALDVVAGEAERHLGQVVGAEGEEVGLLGDLAGPQGRPGRLDHRPDGHLELAPLGRAALAALRRPGCAAPLLTSATASSTQPAGQRQLLAAHGERDHDLDDRVPAVGHPLAGRLHEGAHLHGVEPGLDHPEPHAAGAEHRVGLLPGQRGLVEAALLGVEPDGGLLDRPARRWRAGTRAAAGRAGAR